MFKRVASLSAITSDTSSAAGDYLGGLVGVAGTCSPYTNQYTGLKVKICKNINNLPDTCGGASEIRK